MNFGGDKVLINGPYALAFGIAFLGFAGVTVIGSVAGRAVQQDFEYGTYHFFYTPPIRKADYFFGRLLGAWLTLRARVPRASRSASWSAATGPAWTARASSPHPSCQSFLRPYLFLLLPNLLWLGGCFFVLAALTRQMAPVYVAGVIVLVGYLFAINLLGDMENKTLAALVDPVGRDRARRARALLERRAEERRSEIPLAGELLWNRRCGSASGAVVHARRLLPRSACSR